MRALALSLVLVAACCREPSARRDPATADARPGKQASEVIVGGEAACAHVGDDWWCWGATEPRTVSGEETNDVEFERTSPHVVAWMHGAKQVSVGFSVFCALRPDASVWCLGGAQALGRSRGEESGSTKAIQMQVPAAASIVSSGATTCISTVAGEAHCFGNLPGFGTSKPRRILAPPARSVAIAAEQLCLLGQDGAVWCQSASGPAKKLVEGASAIAGVWKHLCALRESEVWCWGGGLGTPAGVFGDGLDKSTQPTPTKVPGIPAARELWVGELTTCVPTVKNGTWCWGRDESLTALFGDVRPHAVIGLADLSRGQMQGTHGCAFARDGELLCWGANETPHQPHRVSFKETP